MTRGHNIIVDGWAAGQRHPTPIHTPTPTPHAIIQKNYPKRSFLVATHATLKEAMSVGQSVRNDRVEKCEKAHFRPCPSATSGRVSGLVFQFFFSH